MLEAEIKRLADEAKMIVCGYAFSFREDGLIRILDLHHPDSVMVVNIDGELIETNMDPIEQHIVLELCRRNLQFMED